MNVSELFAGVVDHAKRSGLFPGGVNTHEPKSKPEPLSASVWIQRIDPDRRHSGLAATSTRVEFALRVYTPMLSNDPDAIDPAVVTAVDTLMAAYTADFQLGGEALDIDLLGHSGQPMAAVAGYLDVGGTMYRVMTITVPIIVADAWAQTA